MYRMMLLLLLCAPLLIAFEPSVADEKQHAILVTGASTGIGRNITERLAREGYFVYAGARKQKDLDALNALHNVEAVRLDVTIAEDIAAAVEQVRKGGRGLHGLVNNAGVAVIGSLIEVEEEDLDFQLDVNVYGVYRVTRAFAPMIIESKGRITTIGSISGILSGPLFGPYSISKHAVEAFTDSLAAELARFDVAVSVIEPGNYKSAMSQNVLQRMNERGIDFEDSMFREDAERMMGSISSDDNPSPEPRRCGRCRAARTVRPKPEAALHGGAQRAAGRVHDSPDHARDGAAQRAPRLQFQPGAARDDARRIAGRVRRAGQPRLIASGIRGTAPLIRCPPAPAVARSRKIPARSTLE